MRLFAAVAVVAAFAVPAHAQTKVDPAAAKAAYQPCAVCHSVKKGEHRNGPSLAGIFGRKPGTVAGFKYSPAMLAKGGKWDEAALNAYLENPRKTVPGTYMAYMGQRDPLKRATLIAYLKTLK